MNYNDAIFFEDGAWWHWDESWAYRCGPFDTYMSAKRAILAYAESL